jgi:hypothetical protein
MKEQRKLITGILTGIIILAGSAQAYDQPPVNLGFTSFMDGGPPAGPGLYFTEYVQYWHADDFRDHEGDSLLPSFAGEELHAWINLNQLIYQSNQELLCGGKWGLDLIVPVVSLDLDYATAAPGFPKDHGTGIGDVLIGPYIQWDPIMGENGPIFMHRVELQVTLPTGKYSSRKQLNPGANIYTFNPYWAGTLFVTPKLTATTRLHYLYNSKNPDTGVQAGQAVHANFATSYELIPKALRVGINGYYLQQLSDSEIAGSHVADRKERVLGIGPGMLLSLSQDDHIFVNAYVETLAENRPEGTRINMRWVHHF